jgi:hypothetical protein
MVTLTLDRPHMASGLLAQDRIVAVDGYPLDPPHIVDAPLEGGGVRLVAPPGSPVEWVLHPGNHDQVTVERADPPLPRRQRRFLGRGLPWLVCQGPGDWVTEDGRFEVRHEFGGITLCEGPHPVRLTQAMIDHARANPRTLWAWPVLHAHALGRKGFMCEGEMEHDYDLWAVWDTQADDYAGRYGAGKSFEKFADAVAFLVGILRP